MIVFDFETDGLLEQATVIHCIAVVDRDTGVAERYRDCDGHVPADGTIADGLRRIMEAPVIGGQNIHGFDIPVAQKLYPWFTPKGEVRDSKVESEMWYPSSDLRSKDFAAQRKRNGNWIASHLYGSHSLEAWGMRLGCPKDEYKKWCEENNLSPWECWRPQMEDYCVQDVRSNIALFDYLEEKFDYTAMCVKLENNVAPILERQRQWGVEFNVENAGKLHARLTERVIELTSELQKFFPPFYARDGKAKTAKRTLNYKDKLRGDLTEGAPYVPVKLKDFNPGSRQHIYKRLMAVYGWKPEKFTPTGEPQVDEKSMGGLRYPPIPLILEYLLVEKRLGQLAEGPQAWLKQEKDGKIHGRVKANGTRTSRCSHVNPNLGQVPKVSAPYGPECRALFSPRKGRVQMGCDLSGIEMRAQGHYLARFDGGNFARNVVDGDVHELARIALGFHSRDNTKTFEYAMTYGAFDTKLGEITYSDFTEEEKREFGRVTTAALTRLGADRRLRLEQGLTGLDQLMRAVDRSYKRGYLTALDGRKLAVPSKHSALNTLFQGFGGVVAKTWIVEFDRVLKEEGLIPEGRWYIHDHEIDLWKVVQILFVHDEIQTDCVDRETAELAGKLAVKAAQATREILGLNVIIDAAYKVGKDWSECH